MPDLTESHPLGRSLARARRGADRADAAAEALKDGPRGALLVAGIAVALLLVGWLAFYFLLFLPRGPVG